MTETQYSITSDHLKPPTTPKDDDKLNFSTLSSISTLDTSSPFNTISTTASDKTLTGESLVSRDLINSVFSTFSEDSLGDIDLSLNVSRNSLSSNTIVEKHNSVSTKHNSTSTKTNSISKKHNSVVSKVNYESNDISNKSGNKVESKVTQARPKKDFRTPTSSFLLTPTEERFGNVGLDLAASEANFEVPIAFSSISLNLDIGDFTTKSTTQKLISTSPSPSPPPSPPPPPPPTSNRESREEKISYESRGSKVFGKARSGCGCTIM